jgi:glycerophosphoryl diester phosphodiesterase
VQAARFTVLFWQGRAAEHVPQSSYYEVPVGTVIDQAGYAAAANALGQLMVYWTINDVEQMRRLLLNDADGIITDNVAEAAALYRELGYKP